jgi:hypothetical protein
LGEIIGNAHSGNIGQHLIWSQVFSVKQRSLTLSLTARPKGNGLSVTVPLSASSKTVADIVVLMGTPNLLHTQAKQPSASQNLTLFMLTLILIESTTEKWESSISNRALAE